MMSNLYRHTYGYNQLFIISSHAARSRRRCQWQGLVGSLTRQMDRGRFCHTGATLLAQVSELFQSLQRSCAAVFAF